MIIFTVDQKYRHEIFLPSSILLFITVIIILFRGTKRLKNLNVTTFGPQNKMFLFSVSYSC